MSIRRLEYFVAVADELSFTAAADVLNMAQPPLSTQIRLLEDELSTRLFDRGRHGVTLTAAGAVLLPEARRLLDGYRRIGPLARRAAEGEVGRLAVGIIPSAANGRLPAVLRTLRDRSPDLEIALEEGRPGELLRRLTAGQLDVVLQYARPDDEQLAGREIDREKLLLAVPAAHRLAGRHHVPVNAVRGESLILPPRHGGEGLHERITALLVESGVRPAVVHADIWMMQTIVGLVSAGIGVAFVPESAAVIRSAEVSYLPLSGRVAPVPLVAVWRAGDRPPTVERFLSGWDAGAPASAPPATRREDRHAARRAQSAEGSSGEG